MASRSAAARRPRPAVPVPVVMPVMVVVMVIVMAMVVVMVLAVRADSLDVVMMTLLRRADGGLEADHALAVLAHQAIHVDVAAEDAPDPVDERLDHERVVAQVARLRKGDSRV